MSRLKQIQRRIEFNQRAEFSNCYVIHCPRIEPEKSILPQNLYMNLCRVKGDDFGFARVTPFDDRYLGIPFWEWFNYLEDDLCLVLRN